jgi:TonB family protein
MGLRRVGELTGNIDPDLRALAHKSKCVPRLGFLLSGILMLLASWSCQCQAPGIAEAAPQSLPSASSEPNPSLLVVELDQAIIVLKRGLNENWRSRDQYLSAFNKAANGNSTGRPVTSAKRYAECTFDRHLRTHQVWDEGIPIESEVRQTITELTKLREDIQQANDPDRRSTEFHLPPCISLAHRPIVLSTGVAAAMLKTKIDPIYPAEALKHNVTGRVTLRAVIGKDGHVSTLQIISGPAQLHQAALNAVRQWTYQPYQLNNQPVEVETTIDIAFSQH